MYWKIWQTTENLQSAEGQLDSVQIFLYLIRFEVFWRLPLILRFPPHVITHLPTVCPSQPFGAQPNRQLPNTIDVLGFGCSESLRK